MEYVAQSGSSVTCSPLGNGARQSYPPSIICWEENYCCRQGCQLLCYCINTLVEFILFPVSIFLLGPIFLRVYVHPNSCSAFCLDSPVLACVSKHLTRYSYAFSYVFSFALVLPSLQTSYLMYVS